MQAILFVTRECNLACGYCYVEKQAQSVMSEDTARQAVDRLMAFDDPEHTLSFFGGEPLLQYDLIQSTVAYAEQRAAELGKGIRFKIATNGTLATGEVVDFLAQHGFVVELSLDGVPEAHNANRPLLHGGDSYAATVKNLPYLQKKIKTLVGVGVLTPASVPLAAKGARHAMDELGLRSYTMTVDYTGDWTIDDLPVLKTQYEEMAKWYLERSRKGKNFFFSTFDGHIGAHIRGGFLPGTFCDVGRSLYAVGEDGTIYPCVRFAGKPRRAKNHIMGSVDKGLNEKKRQKTVDRNLKPRASCSGCALEGRCFTYCPCLNWDTTGKFHTIPPMLCEHERILVPIVDKVAQILYKENNAAFMKKHYKKKA